uniref:Uncharacterized protein n=1 Tax=Sciurus vulgaris TaxID=55149 RepID=A0A8D2DZZ0_SCIVU
TPMTAAPRWTQAAGVIRKWGGGCMQAALRVSQDRVSGSAVMGGETCSPEKSAPQSPEEPQPTPQDPAGKQ